MRRSLLVVLALAFVAPSARADGFYFTESLGGARVDDQLADHMGNGGFTARVALGIRRGPWAIEGYFSAIGSSEQAREFDDGGNPIRPNGDYNRYASLMMYGADLKYIKPIAPHLDVYLRGGLSHGETDGVLAGYGGRGYGYGAGIQLKGKVSAWGLLCWPLYFIKYGPKITGALYVDAGSDVVRLHARDDVRHGASVDAHLSHLMMGFALGSDF
jgi:hypothetical protein